MGREQEISPSPQSVINESRLQIGGNNAGV